MLIKGIKYYGDDFRFHYGNIEIADGRFARVTERGAPPEGCDCMLPGLIDIHVHGSSGADFSDGDYDGLVTMARFLAREGTTGFSATSITLPEQTIAKAYKAAARLRGSEPAGCARILGITMEGPFFNEKKKGAQSGEYLRLPDVSLFERLQKAADGMIHLICVAPELEGAVEFIQAVSRTGVTVAAAHTEADYEEAVSGFDSGITHLTHLFNAMPPFLHREPGIIGAAAERSEVTAELICDGVHVHPSAVRAAFKLFGAGRICLVSDAVAACGTSGGCMLGGQRVTVSEGRAALSDGTIAGSVLTLFDCLKKAVAFGIAPEDAVRCAAANPARVLGIDDTGIIAEGKRADFLICGDDFKLKDVYISGKRLERTQ